MTNDPEWVEWSAAIRLLTRGGVPSPWMAIQNWAAHGQVDSRAGNIISDEGAFLTDDVLPKEAWLAKPRPTNGALRFSVPHAFDDGQPDTVLHILAPRFRKDQLVALLPHLSADEVEAALRGDETEEERLRPAKTSREMDGGRRLSDRWPNFLAELMLWFEEANDDTAGLTSGKLITKINERLACKGIAALPRSTAEPAIKRMLEVLNDPKRTA